MVLKFVEQGQQDAVIRIAEMCQYPSEIVMLHRVERVPFIINEDLAGNAPPTRGRTT